jgi:CBS domain-containing protein
VNRTARDLRNLASGVKESTVTAAASRRIAAVTWSQAGAVPAFDLQHGLVEATVKIKGIMAQPAWTCGPGTNLASVVETMWTHDCGIVPVVNERGEAVGVVTDRDICIALGTRNTTAAMLTARDVMSAPVAGCVPEDDCFVALMTMQERGVHRLPVLGIGDVVLGIVSLDDIVKHAALVPATDPLRIGVMEVLAAVGGHKETPQLAGTAR